MPSAEAQTRWETNGNVLTGGSGGISNSSYHLSLSVLRPSILPLTLPPSLPQVPRTPIPTRSCGSAWSDRARRGLGSMEDPCPASPTCGASTILTKPTTRASTSRITDCPTAPTSSGGCTSGIQDTSGCVVTCAGRSRRSGLWNGKVDLRLVEAPC